MKTTVEIEDRLLRAARRAAEDLGTTLRAVLEAGLRQELTRPARRPSKLNLITHPGGLASNLDLSRRRKMWEWLEANEPKPRSR